MKPSTWVLGVMLLSLGGVVLAADAPPTKHGPMPNGLLEAAKPPASTPAASGAIGRDRGKAPRATSRDMPDLVPTLGYDVMRVSVVVKNVGAASAHPSKLTISCQRSGHAAACAGLRAMGGRIDPAFPGRVTVQVPALAASARFTHTIDFRDARLWDGRHQFRAIVDAADSVREGNERNNGVGFVYEPGS